MINKNALQKEIRLLDKKIKNLDEKIVEMREKSAAMKKERNEFMHYLARFDELEKTVTEKLESRTHFGQNSAAEKNRVQTENSAPETNKTEKTEHQFTMDDILPVENTTENSSDETTAEKDLDFDKYFNH